MLIGAHVSPAGGPAKAVARGVQRGARAIQIFNQNPRAWKPRVYSADEVAGFHAAFGASNVEALLIHAVYLLNCASEDPQIRARSLHSLTSSLRTGAALGHRRGSRGVRRLRAAPRRQGRDRRRRLRRVPVRAAASRACRACSRRRVPTAPGPRARSSPWRWGCASGAWRRGVTALVTRRRRAGN